MEGAQLVKLQLITNRTQSGDEGKQNQGQLLFRSALNLSGSDAFPQNLLKNIALLIHGVENLLRYGRIGGLAAAELFGCLDERILQIICSMIGQTV